MPAVLDFNAPAIAPRFDQAAAYLGIADGFDGFCRFVQDLNDGLGIPRKLAELGVTTEPLEALISGALDDPSCGGNPRPLTHTALRDLFLAVV